MYQVVPSLHSTIDARGQIRPPCSIFNSGHIKIMSLLQTNLRHEDVFWCLEYDKKLRINERKSPKRYGCKIKFPLIWLNLLKTSGQSCSKDHFFTYVGSSCIGFITQVREHTMLYKHGIKITSLNMKSTPCYINFCSFSYFEQCINKDW